MYIVIHALDPYLLARMATDLQMEEFINHEEFNNLYNPFSEKYFKCNFMNIVNNRITFFSKNFGGKCKKITESNYLSTLSFILKNKDK